MDKNWKRFGDVSMISNGQGGYILKFFDEITRCEVLENRPWFIVGQPFFLRKLSPNMNTCLNEVSKVPIWAKLFGIPLEF